jgi:hypothetical protein
MVDVSGSDGPRPRCRSGAFPMCVRSGLWAGLSAMAQGRLLPRGNLDPTPGERS